MPRAFLPIAGAPLLSYALHWLHDDGIGRAVVCLNRNTAGPQSRLAGHLPGFDGLIYQEDPMPRGPAGCARDAATRQDADTFVVVHGTAIPHVKLPELLARHYETNAAMTVVVHHEKTRGTGCRQVPCGIYVVERRVLEPIRAVGYVDIKEHLIPALYQAGERVLTFAVNDPGPRVLDLATYLSANEWTIQQLALDWGGRALNGRGASVAEDATLIGPVWLGEGATVKAGAIVVGPSSIGAGSTIESGALLSRSAIWNNCTVGREAVADHCLLADYATLRPGRHEIGSVIGGTGIEREPVRPARTIPSLAERVRRRFNAKSARDAVVDAGTTATAS